MANIKIPRKTFEKEIGKLDDKMKNSIALFGTTLESYDDNEIELEIFPNRPDLLSYHGFKRSFLFFLGKKTGLKTYKLNAPEKDYKVVIDSSVKDVRPFTACAIIKGMNFDDEKIKEIIDIQEKLHSTIGRKRKKLAIGIYPLEKITLPIRLLALEPDKIKFQPLESPREMDALQILTRHPAGRDYAHLLAGKTKFPIFIDASDEILSMPPIINSQLTGRVTTHTKDLFIECSGFDLNTLKKCLNILVTTFADMGGKIYQMEVKYKKTEITPDLTPQIEKISIDHANKLIGLDLNEKQLKECIEKMGHNYKKGQVEIPAWRTDILHEVDIIEDIAIGYGYENLVPEIPKISTIGEENPRETIKRKISEILSGTQMLETNNYHLTTLKDQFIKMGIQEKQIKGQIEVEDSKTEYTLLRNDLIHYSLKNFGENIDSEYPQKIYETGRVFNEKADNSIEEHENLSISIAPGNFTELKQIIEYLSRMLDINFQIKEAQKTPAHFIEGRTAQIEFDDEIIGYMGEIHPKILRNWKIKMPVTSLEISLEKIFEKLI